MVQIKASKINRYVCVCNPMPELKIFNCQPLVYMICLLICQSPSDSINTTKLVKLLTTIALYMFACHGKIIKVFHMRWLEISLIIDLARKGKFQMHYFKFLYDSWCINQLTRKYYSLISDHKFKHKSTNTKLFKFN